eukprot:TRINITY_DN3680_c0_g1_i1.p1 TRINITY_DN3680_c0_g1~~TRINITY_DN3680_c0_g1_i1.p1  ORF type:complete len:145 (-),score=54.67 TRINITY_DN3680_c0_g1_i1:371-805(-)
MAETFSLVEGEESNNEEIGEIKEDKNKNEEENGEVNGEKEMNVDENGENEDGEKPVEEEGTTAQDDETSSNTGGKESNTKTTKKNTLQFPLARIRKIIKSDPEVKMVATDATLAISRSTELFVEMLVKEAYNNSPKEGKDGKKF